MTRTRRINLWACAGCVAGALMAINLPVAASAAVLPDLSTITYNSALADGLHSGGQGGTSKLLWSSDWTEFGAVIPGADFSVGQTVTYTDAAANGGIREFVENHISDTSNVGVVVGLGFVIREGNSGTTSLGWTLRSQESAGPAPILRITTANSGVIDAVLVEDTYISSDSTESNTNFSGATTLNFRTHTSTWRNPLIRFDLPLLPSGDSVVQVDLILTSASDPAGTGGTPDIEVVALVPEPASLALLSIGGALILRRRR